MKVEIVQLENIRSHVKSTVPFTHGLPIITAGFASIRAGNFILQLYHLRRNPGALEVIRGHALRCSAQSQPVLAAGWHDAGGGDRPPRAGYARLWNDAAGRIDGSTFRAEAVCRRATPPGKRRAESV